MVESGEEYSKTLQVRAGDDQQNGNLLACTPSIWQGRAGGSETQGYPWLHKEFKASLAYMRPFLIRRWGGGRKGVKKSFGHYCGS